MFALWCCKSLAPFRWGKSNWNLDQRFWSVFPSRTDPIDFILLLSQVFSVIDELMELQQEWNLKSYKSSHGTSRFAVKLAAPVFSHLRLFSLRHTVGTLISHVVSGRAEDWDRWSVTCVYVIKRLVFIWPRLHYASFLTQLVWWQLDWMGQSDLFYCLLQQPSRSATGRLGRPPETESNDWPRYNESFNTHSMCLPSLILLFSLLFFHHIFAHFVSSEASYSPLGDPFDLFQGAPIHTHTHTIKMPFAWKVEALANLVRLLYGTI